MKKIIGLAGEMGAGKDTFCQFVKENYPDVFMLKFSDPLTEALKIFLDSIKREDQQWLSSSLRERFGGDILIKALTKKVNSIEKGIIILNGVRRGQDFDSLREIGGKLIYISTDIKARWERVKVRGEKADDDVPFEKFQEMGNAEAEQQITQVGKQADFKIENNGSIEEFNQEIKKVIDSI